MITYVSVELGRLFGSLYEGCDSLNTLSEAKNIRPKWTQQKTKVDYEKLLCEAC